MNTPLRLAFGMTLGLGLLAGPTYAQMAENDAIGLAYSLPASVKADGQAAIDLAIAAVTAATPSGQPPVTTGTVTQAADGSVTYASDPADRLVVILADGRRFEFQIAAGFQYNGDLRTVHNLSFSVTTQDGSNMQFSSSRDAQGNVNISANGTYVKNGRTYSVALNSAGTYAFNTDSTGTYFRDDYNTTGTVVDAADNFSLTANEAWHFELIQVGRRVDTAAARTLRSQMTLGTDLYEWVAAQTQWSMRDGRPSQLDTYWQAVGVINKDGAQFGTYRLDLSLPGFVRFVVDLPTSLIELARFAVPIP